MRNVMVFSFTRRVVYRSFFTVKISILKNEVEIKKEIKIEIILIIEYVEFLQSMPEKLTSSSLK